MKQKKLPHLGNLNGNYFVIGTKHCMAVREKCLRAGLVFLALMCQLTAFAQLQANFAPDRQSGCAPLLVRFTDNSTGNPLSWEWDFGNGNKATQQHPNANYTQPGVYTVKLTVKNASGSHTATQTIRVFKNPTADFTHDKAKGCVPLTVKFTDKSTPGDAAIQTYNWDFGDGNVSSAPSPTHTYTTVGSFTLTLTVRDANGCSHVVQKTNQIKTSDFAPDFTIHKPYGCSTPHTTDFTPSVSGQGPFTYSWDFGNGQTSNLSNPSATYNSTGRFTIKLTVTNQDGCQKTHEKALDVEIVSPSFNFKQGNKCAASTISFENTTPGDGWTWDWDFGNGKKSTARSPENTYYAPGAYTVTLKAKRYDCPALFVSKTVTVKSEIAAVFSADKKVLCSLPETVKFTDNTPKAIAWAWDFGDGGTSDQQNPSYQYTQEGDFTVRLTVTTNDTCQKTFTLPHSIYAFIPDFKIDTVPGPTRGCAPLTTILEAVGGGPASLGQWKWTTSDGKQGTGKVATITFDKIGVYTVTFSAVSDQGCEVSRSQQVRVGLPPKGDFTADKKIVCASESVGFTFKQEGGITPDLYRWAFSGTGTSVVEATEPVISYKFGDTGWIRVTLEASFNGCPTLFIKDSFVKVLPPVAKFSSAEVACRLSDIKFTNQSLGGDSYQWTFGDGNASTSASPTHRYQDTGTYKIQFVVCDSKSGCCDTAISQIKILPPLEADFSASPTAGCGNLSTSFLPSSSRPGKSYWWYVDNTLRSNNEIFVMEFDPGFYTITLRVVDTAGCTTTVVKPQYIKVHDAKVQFTALASSKCLPTQLTLSDKSISSAPVVLRTWKIGSNPSFSTQSKDTVVSIETLQPGYPQQNGLPIELAILQDNGCRFSEVQHVDVTKPHAQLKTHVAKGCGADLVMVTANTSDTALAKPATIRWTLSNGMTSSANPASFTLSGDELITVKLLVTDRNQCQDSAFFQYYVNTIPPVAAFSAAPLSSSCPPLVVYFTDESYAPGLAPIKSWFWDFGDGGTSSLPHPAKTYVQGGSYTIKLTVTDTLGCPNTLVKENLVEIGGPAGSYSFSPNRQCPPMKVQFKADSRNAAQHIWDMGDGTVYTYGSEDTASHVFTEPGSYIPSLILVDSADCRVPIFPAPDTIVVRDTPGVAFGPAYIKGCRNIGLRFYDSSENSIPIVGWEWQFGDGETSTEKNPVHYYQDTGTYAVTLELTNQYGCKSSLTRPHLIKVFDNEDPPQMTMIYRATVESSSQIRLEFAANHDTDFLRYNIYRAPAGGQFSLIARVAGRNDTVFLDNNVSTAINSYCYRVEVEDACHNLSGHSPEHCTVKLKATGVPKGISLKWNHYVGWDQVATYHIYRKEADTPGEMEEVGQVPGNTNSFFDPNVDCTFFYDYRILAEEEEGHRQWSWSNVSRAKSGLPEAPMPKAVVRATVENDEHVLIEWEKVENKSPFLFHLFRSINGVDYEEIAKLSDTASSYIDREVAVDNHSYYYVLRLQDACGNPLSPTSNVARTIKLDASPGEGTHTVASSTLAWNPYIHWDAGALRYDVEFFVESQGQFILIGQRQPLETLMGYQYTTHNIYQRDYCFRITALNAGDTAIYSRSNVDCVPPVPTLFAPNVFTPNDDDDNDVFKVRGSFILGFELRVYNRWGTLMYQSNDITEGWDGTFQGVPCQEGVYIYQAIGQARNRLPIVLKGNVTLMR